MSWYLSVVGKSSKLAEVVKEKFEKTGGCPHGSAEELVKNELGKVAETLCKSLVPNVAVSILASGSAYTQGGEALSQSCKFEFSTHGEFVE